MNPSTQRVEPRSTSDLPTVIAVSIVVYALANILHEAVGHGGACLLVGGRPQVLTSISFESDTEGLSRAATRWIEAGGTLVNLAAAALVVALTPLAARASVAFRYFLWLFVTVNLLQATGYFLFSGVAGVGDWAALTADLSPVFVPRIVLAVVGGLGYWLSIRFALERLAPFLGTEPSRRLPEASLLTVVPYVTGGVFYTLSGLWNPHGMKLVFISAIAASFGGTSGLAWCAQLLKGSSACVPEGAALVSRSRVFIAAALVLAVLFAAVLGPGVRLG